MILIVYIIFVKIKIVCIKKKFNMHIGYLSLQQSTFISRITQKSSRKVEKKEIYVSRSSFIEIFVFNEKNGKIISWLVINFFSQIIFHASFCFKNDLKSYLLIFEKNGNILIIKIEDLKNFFLIDSINLKKFLKEKNFYGSNLALDKKNMNFMIFGIQTAKFVSSIKQNEILNPVFSNKSFEIKKNFVICHYIINIQSRIKNISKFASIETFYNRPYEKILVFYYVNFQSNNLKRKIICQLNNTSYFLIYISNQLKRKEFIIVLSEGFFTFINLKNLEIFIKNLPFKKKKNRNKIYRVSYFSFFVTEKKAFYLFTNEDGDLLKFNIFFKFKNNQYTLNSNFQYLDSIDGKISSIQVLESGFIFLSMEAGNHLYFQFISFKKNQNKNIRFCFLSRYNYKNILLLEEFLQNLPIISVDFIEFVNNKQPFFLLLCGTKTRSSIRLLNYGCLIKRILCEKLNDFALGINIIKKKKNFFYVLISFKISTSIFYLNKKLGEVNNSFFLTNSSTFLAKYIDIRQGIFQSTDNILRFIKIFQQKNKISEWKLSEKIFITNSVIIEKNVVHIFILISTFKGILIEILKDGSLIELESVNLINSKFNILFGINIKIRSKKTWDFMIFCGKEEKSIRTYSFNKNFFMKLIGIKLLSWYPISAKFFIHSKKIFLLISLDDGQLVFSSFNYDTGHIKIEKIIKVTNSPLYISNGTFLAKMLCFGLKLWLLEKNLSKNYSVKQISNQPMDIVECYANLIVSIFKNKIYILKNKIKFQKIHKFLIFDIFSTPIDISFFDKNQKNNFICFICSEISHRLLSHQINLNKKKKFFLESLFFFENKKNDSSNILFLTSFYQFSINKKILDFAIYRGAHTNEHWKSIYSVKFYKSVQIIIVSSILLSCIDRNYNPLNKQTESNAKSSYLLCFYIRKKLKYSPNEGGRVDIKNNICFIFKENIYYQMTLNSILIISKKSFGKRFTILNGNYILVIEVNLNNLETIFKFNGSFFCLLEIDILKNTILTLDSIQGFKIFTLKSKQKSVKLTGENYLLNNILCGKIIDPTTFIISDKLGNLYLFRHENSNTLFKQINLVNNFKNFLKLTCHIVIPSPVLKILTMNYLKKKSVKEIYLVCIDGHIILLKPILNQRNILYLEKIFNKINKFLNIINKKNIKSNYKILCKTGFKCLNIDMLFFYFRQKKNRSLNLKINL
jgi:hypothetical protein